jgi:hypothetical protein
LGNSVSCIASVEVRQEGQTWAPAGYLQEIRRPEYDWRSSAAIDLSKAFVGGVYLTQAGELLAVKAVYCLYCNDPTTSVEVLKVIREEVDWRAPNNWKKCISDSVWVGIGECLVQVPMKMDIRVVLDLRWRPSGWIHTQTENASIKLSQVGDRTQLTVEGSSVQIPEFTVTFNSEEVEDRKTWCDLRYSLNQYGSDPLGFCGEQPKFRAHILHNVDTLGKGSGLGDPVQSFNRLTQLQPALNRATSENVTWRFSIKPNNTSTGKCLSQGFIGSVGGNAMAVDSGIPMWSTKDSTLNFAVTSPHLDSAGEVSIGTYELQLRQETARCLWGVAVTPQNAQFSIYDQNGIPKIAVAVVSVADDMVRFRATGFTYSIAQFRIGLAAKSAKRIQCRKGSRRIFLKVGSSRCPSGWQRT